MGNSLLFFVLRRYLWTFQINMMRHFEKLSISIINKIGVELSTVAVCSLVIRWLCRDLEPSSFSHRG